MLHGVDAALPKSQTIRCKSAQQGSIDPKAFERQDATYINSQYAFPMIFYAENGTSAQMDKSQFARNSQGLMQRYREIGVARIDYDMASIQVLNASLSLVSINWRFQRADGSDIYAATTRYLLRTQENELRIVAVFVVDEVSKWEKLQASSQATS